MTVVASGQLTIVDVNDGTDGVSVIVSNEAHALPASSGGAVSSYAGSGATIQVFEGSTALAAVSSITANGQFTVGTPTQTPAATLTVGAITYAGTTATVAQHSAMTTASTTVVITYPITIRLSDGSTVTVNKSQTITKAKAGTAGTAGVRGSRRYYLPNHTTWVAADATAAASEDGGPVNHDVVTQYGTGFSETRYWDASTSAWVPVAEVIDGNLLVNGSVVADKVDTRGLTIKDAAGNVVFSAGNASEFTNFTPAKTWEFRGTADGWVVSNATLTTNTDSVTVAATTTSPQFYNNAVSIVGAVHSRIRLRVRRLAGSGWRGRVYYRTAAHVYSATYIKDVTAVVGSDWVTLEWDMSGIPDWVASTITGIRFDLGTTTADQFEIDWVSVGKLGVAGAMAALDRITPENVGTYIADAAIGTLKIAGNSVFASTRGIMVGTLDISTTNSWQAATGFIYPGVVADHSGAIHFVVCLNAIGVLGNATLLVRVVRSDGVVINAGDTPGFSIYKDWTYSYSFTTVDPAPVEGAGYKVEVVRSENTGTIRLTRLDFLALSGKR